jgi:hypothetical protein
LRINLTTEPIDLIADAIDAEHGVNGNRHSRWLTAEEAAKLGVLRQNSFLIAMDVASPNHDKR